MGNFRRYYRLSNRTVLAMKFVGGLAHPIGKATVVPFDRRFYSGGASSVRGWRLRQLGPGAASFRQDDNRRTETSVLGGDIKLETSLELRQTVARDRLGAEWILAHIHRCRQCMVRAAKPRLHHKHVREPDWTFCSSEPVQGNRGWRGRGNTSLVGLPDCKTGSSGSSLRSCNTGCGVLSYGLEQLGSTFPTWPCLLIRNPWKRRSKHADCGGEMCWNW